MSQSLSWIDPSAFSAALNKAGFDPSKRVGEHSRGPMWFSGVVGSKPPPAVSSRVAVDYKSDSPAPVGYSPAQSSAAVRTVESGPAASGLAGSRTATPTIELETRIPELTLDSDRLDQRLDAYMAWVEGCTECKGLFIVDEEGLVLMERESDPNLVALSAYFLNLKDRIPDSLGTRSEGSIAIDLEDDRVLHVVQADTRLGPHALGFTVRSPLHRDMTQGFQDTLSRVFAAMD